MDEDEFLEPVGLPLSEALDMVRDGRDGRKTIARSSTRRLLASREDARARASTTTGTASTTKTGVGGISGDVCPLSPENVSTIGDADVARGARAEFRQTCPVVWNLRLKGQNTRYTCPLRVGARTMSEVTSEAARPMK